MFKVTLTFDSYEEALRVKQSAIDILNEYMSGEDPCEHKNHGTPENALEIFVDALHEQVPVKDLDDHVEHEQVLTEKVMGSRDDAIDKDAWDDFKSALEGGNDD